MLKKVIIILFEKKMQLLYYLKKMSIYPISCNDILYLFTLDEHIGDDQVL